MVEPTAFSSNPETAKDNVFQNAAAGTANSKATQEAALKEFKELVQKLQEAGVSVTVMRDSTETPDAVFPNNWIAFLERGGNYGSSPVVSLFPMMSALRRCERRSDIVRYWMDTLGVDVKDYSSFEKKGMFLEGTGSMVLDRRNRIVYACLSQRTNATLLKQFCQDLGYELVSFHAYGKSADGNKVPIYHTNVMMQIGTTFAVVCLDSIVDDGERELVRTTVERCGKEIVPITLEQMSEYACNCLQLQGPEAVGNILVMSTRAHNSFTTEQLALFSRHSCTVVHSDLTTIEYCGGGSARCMIAEVFPPQS